jgi:hypothetical protein
MFSSHPHLIFKNTLSGINVHTSRTMNRRNRSHQDMASESASEDAPSPAKAHHGGAEGESQNHTKATKRSCNNCRQQKVYILFLTLERTLVNLHQA